MTSENEYKALIKTLSQENESFQKFIVNGKPRLVVEKGNILIYVTHNTAANTKRDFLLDKGDSNKFTPQDNENCCTSLATLFEKCGIHNISLNHMETDIKVYLGKISFKLNINPGSGNQTDLEPLLRVLIENINSVGAENRALALLQKKLTGQQTVR